MLLMLFIMSLPLLGIALFLVLPFAAALPAYLAVVVFSAFYLWLMMRAMRLPKRTGTRQMIGSMVTVLDWKGNSGQVICEGEIWHAAAKGSQTFRKGERVAVTRINGLTLLVKPLDKQPGKMLPAAIKTFDPRRTRSRIT